MNALHIKNTVLAVLAVAGSAIAQALGGWDVALKVLICFMALDYVTGWLVAAVWHKSAKSKTGALDSKASYKGLVKRALCWRWCGWRHCWIRPPAAISSGTRCACSSSPTRAFPYWRTRR